MRKMVNSDAGTNNSRVTVAKGGELARKLERVFQSFARAQEDWAVKHGPVRTACDTKHDADSSG